MSDYYGILRISPQADEAEVRAAFRRLSLQLHPDRNPDPEAVEQFKLVTEAYDVLSDKNARAAYDEALMSYRQPAGGVSIQDILAGIGSVTGLFMEAAARANPGKVKPGKCRVCEGAGKLSVDLGVIHISKRCEACQGHGEIQQPVPTGREIL